LKDLSKVVLFQIDQTSRFAKQHSQKIMDEHGMGITVDQWVLLKIIHESGPLSQTELARLSVRDPASITRTLDLLQKKELVLRERIPDNRRQYNILLSKVGNAFVKKHMSLIDNLRKQSTNGLSDKEIEQLTTYLKRMQENMS